MTQPNLQAHAADGRWFLEQTDRSYDVIALDAYRPPYIPFHLTTKEFFVLVRDHLSQDGVLAINVARAAEDDSLVQAISATVADVFPSVYAIPEPIPPGEPLGNTLVVATIQPTQVENLAQNLRGVEAPLLQQVAARTVPQAEPAPAGGPLLTDDRAPVEQIVHGIILRYLLGS
jgi:spermidine synthase